jgi:hypothetical protein
MKGKIAHADYKFGKRYERKMIVCKERKDCEKGSVEKFFQKELFHHIAVKKRVFSCFLCVADLEEF